MVAKTGLEPNAMPTNPATLDELPSAEADARTRLIQATQRLLANRPPSGITGKQIAKESGVHYGLIYHYFASKDELFLVAMRELTSAYISHREQTVDRHIALPPLTLQGHEAWWRAAANISADGGATYTALGWTYPVLNYELEQILKHHPEVQEFEAKAHIVREVCMNFGWVFFKNTLQTGMKLSDQEMQTIEHDVTSRRR